MKKTVVEVQEYEKPSAAMKHKDRESTKVEDKEKGAQTMMTRTEKAANDSSGSAVTDEAVTAGRIQSPADFTETLKAIDEAINKNLGPQRSHIGQLEVNEANNGKGADMEIVESKATITDQKSVEIKDIPCFQKHMELGDLM